MDKIDGTAPTAAFVALHAKTAPSRVAIVENGRSVPYRALNRDVAKTAAALSDLGIARGHRVGVEIASPYLHWVILLACEVLGAPTLSYTASEEKSIEGRLDPLDWVLSARVGETALAQRRHHVSPAWCATVAGLRYDPPPIPDSLPDEAPIRLIKSYGTSGALEFMMHTARVHAFWVGQFQARAEFDAGSRYLVSMGFHVQALHAHATACLRAGGTCVFDTETPVGASLKAHGITHATFLPSVLERLVSNEIGIDPTQRLKRIFTIGAAASAALRRDVFRTLADDLSESYGSNETGGICGMDGTGSGTVFPGVVVETVDETDAPVFGTPGEIRVKSPGTVDGYLGDAAMTNRMFRGGWFYPGDIGVMTDRTSLTLLGRIEDSIAVDGTVHALPELEKALAEDLPADDICLIARRDAGRLELTVVVVATSDADFKETCNGLRSRLPTGIDAIRAVKAGRIPRSADGTVQRAKLGWHVAETLSHGKPG